MKRYIYRVTCLTKEHNARIYWSMDMEADSKKEAIRECLRYWCGEAHPFHLEAYRYRDDEIIDGIWFWSRVK